MNYVLQLLEDEKNGIEKRMRNEDLMRKDLRQANICLKQIHELKRAIKLIKGKNRD